MKVDVKVDTFKCAEFELFVPPGPVAINGILVIVPGSNDDGRFWIRSKYWQEFAQREGLATIGCKFQDKDPNVVEGYADAKIESGQALLSAIRLFEEEYPELKGLKLLLWGFSAGGQFNYEFNAHFPDRVLAWVVNKGGIYYTALCDKAARQNPGLMFVGEHDAEYRVTLLLGLYYVNRIAGQCKWDLVVEKTGHELGESVTLSQKFFSKVLKAQRDGKVYEASK